MTRIGNITTLAISPILLYCLISQIALAHQPASSVAESNSKSQAQQQTRVALTDCEIPGVEGKVRCGEYEVFENRAAQKGRKIKLKIVVYPATGADRAPDPFVYIPGGPG